MIFTGIGKIASLVVLSGGSSVIKTYTAFIMKTRVFVRMDRW